MEHRFNVQFAKDYGIEEAILIENLYFWIAKNVANGKHKHERRYWTYNSAKAFAELFPYINETKIYRVLAHLEDVEFIIKGKFSQDKHDRTNWYSFSDKGLSRLNAEKYDTINFSETFQNGDMDFAKMQNGNCKNANCILINKTDIKQQIENKEEDIIISSKKNDYQAIVDNQLDCENQDLGFLNQANQGQISTTNNNINNKVLNEIKEKEDNKLSSQKKANNQDVLAQYDLRDVPSEFVDIVRDWCQYKKERKERYKTQSSFMAMVKRLIKLSSNNVDKAKEIIEQSIANNYAGLFELKQRGNNNPIGFILEKGREEKYKKNSGKNW